MPVTPSRFVRHDLMCTDVPAGRRFYADLFGWTTTEVKVMDFTVVRLTHGDQVLGAVMPFNAGPAYRSHWVPYVFVKSVDACCKRIPELGGDVCMGAMDIPPGRFALVNDPQKAIFSPFAPKGGSPAEAPARPGSGSFCWDELLTSDVAGAVRFYTSLFGWGSSEKEMGAAGAYTLLRRGSEAVAGVMKLSPDAGHPPMWLSYVAVDDADAAAERARKLGAEIAVPPTEVPGVGRFAVLRDPAGAAIGILKGLG